LLHLLLLARVRAVAARPAYLAAIFTFVLVMYGTFLTRSGVLSDFSTHSFTDEGVGGLLASFVMITAVVSLGLLALRWPNLPDGELYPAVKSREFCLAATAVVFAAIGVIILVGMSTPLITMLIGSPHSVSTSFYNTTTLPLAAVMAMFLVVGPLINWGECKTRLLKCYWWLVVVGFAAAISALWVGIHHPLALATVGLSVAAITASLLAIRNRVLHWPAGLTHVGVAVALIGILVSSIASQSVFTSFEQGESQQVLGSKITYLGNRLEPTGQGFYQSFRLEGVANAVLEPFTKLNKEGRPAAREPGIYRGLAADIYLAPLIQQASNPIKEFTLRKGEQTQEQTLTVKLLRFGMAGNDPSGDIRVYALLEIAKDGNVQEARPELISRNGQIVPVPFKVFDHYEILLNAVSLKEGTVGLGLNDLSAPPQPQRVDVEVSRKPLINLVWLGTIFMTIGTFWSGVIRSRSNTVEIENIKQPTAAR
jgi:cytochrome c-type biogenesis protein CcmF